MKKFFLLLIVSFFLCSCVSDYKGRKPDFSLKGESARKEIERFRLSDHFLDQRRNAFEMGPEGETEIYLSESLKPIIREVSPAALKELEVAEKWTRLWWIPYGIAIGVLAVEVANKDKDWHPASTAVFWSALGTSVGFSFYQLSVMQNTTKIYNEDLKSKFAPGIGYNAEF